ncbi:MAG: HD domain-containing protein [Kosmotoga sp.]|nr:MAG: HD domain-containing protein [Kosmotoga sp.]
MGRLSLRESLNRLNKTKVIIKIIVALCIVGFLISMAFTFMKFSQTYTERYKEEFVITLNDAFNNLHNSGIVTNPVENGTVKGIIMEKIFSGEKLAFGKGLFINENSFKKIVNKENGKVLVEVPLRMIIPIFSVTDDILWYLADSDGNILNTSIQGRTAEEPRTLDFTKNRLVYYSKYKLTNDLTLGIGYIIPSMIFWIVFVGALAAVFLLWYFENFIDRTSTTLEEIIKGIGMVKSHRESFSSSIKDIESLNRFLDDLRYQKSKNEDTIRSLKKEIEKLNIELSTIKEKSYLKLKNLMQEFSTSVYKRFFDYEIDIEYFTELALLTAQKLGVTSKEELEAIELGLLAVDLGTIYITDYEYIKRDESEEFYRRHPIHGEEMFKRIEDFELVCDIVRHHHERYDGEGFPDGLKGEKLSLRSKIVSLVSSYMAYVLPDPCGEGNSVETALEKIRKEKGKKFDPEVVKAFEEILVTSK